VSYAFKYLISGARAAEVEEVMLRLQSNISPRRKTAASRCKNCWCGYIRGENFAARRRGMRQTAFFRFCGYNHFIIIMYNLKKS